MKCWCQQRDCLHPVQFMPFSSFSFNSPRTHLSLQDVYFKRHYLTALITPHPRIKINAQIPLLFVLPRINRQLQRDAGNNWNFSRGPLAVPPHSTRIKNNATFHVFREDTKQWLPQQLSTSGYKSVAMGDEVAFPRGGLGNSADTHQHHVRWLPVDIAFEVRC